MPVSVLTERAPVWVDNTHECAEGTVRVPVCDSVVVGFWVLRGALSLSSPVTSAGATETSHSAVWEDPRSHSFPGKNNSAKSPTTEWAKGRSCMLEHHHAVRSLRLGEL